MTAAPKLVVEPEAGPAITAGTGKASVEPGRGSAPAAKAHGRLARPWRLWGLAPGGLVGWGLVLAVLGAGLFGGTYAYTRGQVLQRIVHDSHHLEGMYHTFLQNQLDFMRRLAQTTVAVHALGASLTAPSDARQVAAAEQFLRQVRLPMGALSISVVAAEGRLVASSESASAHKPFGPGPVSSREVRDALRYGHAELPRLGSDATRPSLFLAHPLERGGVRLGAVVLEFPLDLLRPPFATDDHRTHYLLADEYGIVFASTAESLLYRSLAPLPEDALAAVRADRRYPVSEFPHLPAIVDRSRAGARLLALQLNEPQHGHGHGHGAAQGHAGPASNYVLSVGPIAESDWRYLVLAEDTSHESHHAGHFRENMTIAGLAYAVILLAVISLVQHRAYMGKLRERAIRDPLTRLYTRRYMDEAVGALLARHGRHPAASFALIMFDIDRFKQVNDSHGHQCGDLVLERVAGSIIAGCRGDDVPVRFGGEEIALFAPAADRAAAVALAERLRVAIGKLGFEPAGRPLNVTVSAGVALHRTGESLEQLVARADDRLYQAKSNGRNQVCADS